MGIPNDILMRSIEYGESVAVHIKKWYDKENPASWQEHLSHVLPDPYKIQRVKHFSSLPYSRIYEKKA